MKISIIGTHGTGKTTLAYQIAAESKQRGLNAVVVNEIARTCPFPLNENFSIEGAQWIITSQVNKELDAVAQKAEMIVCDRSSYDPICYLHAGNILLTNNDKLRDFAAEWMMTYDIIFFVVPSEMKLVDDGIRCMDTEYQQKVHEEFMKFFSRYDCRNVKVVDSFKIFDNNLSEVYEAIFK